MDFRIQIKQVTGSTNDDIWELAQHGEASGAVVCARQQLTGRGKFQRPWAGPAGGLYFSVLIRPRVPQNQWGSLTLDVGRNFAAILREYCGVGPETIWVKEPNDVMSVKGKMVGILTEAKSLPVNGGLEPVIIVGCGINVFRPAETLQTDGRNTSAFISDFVDFSDPDREAILNHLLDLLLDGISVACEPLGIQ